MFQNVNANDRIFIYFEGQIYIYIFNEHEHVNFFISNLKPGLVSRNSRAPTMAHRAQVIKNMIVYTTCHRYVDGGLQYFDAVKHTSQYIHETNYSS